MNFLLPKLPYLAKTLVSVMPREGVQSFLLKAAKTMEAHAKNMSSESLGGGGGSRTLQGYETLSVSIPSPYVYHIRLNRPDKLNALNNAMWRDIREAFNDINDDSECRVVILSAEGRMFTAGLDFVDMSSMGGDLSGEEDVARRCKALHKKIREYQASFTAIEKCSKPVICSVHGACIGGGVDMISGADIRLCSEDAWFQIKEVDIGMAADVGTLQRLPKAIGSRSLVNELALTARKFHAKEAKECGFVSNVYPSKESAELEALKLAINIAAKSPVAVQMTKRALIYSRDHTVEEGLEYMAAWNQTLLQSEDFLNAVMATATKSAAPHFSKL